MKNGTDNTRIAGQNKNAATSQDLASYKQAMTARNWVVMKPMPDQFLFSMIHTALTHWGRYKMANIFQTTFSNAFSSLKMFQLRLKFH